MEERRDPVVDDTESTLADTKRTALELLKRGDRLDREGTTSGAADAYRASLELRLEIERRWPHRATGTFAANSALCAERLGLKLLRAGDLDEAGELFSTSVRFRRVAVGDGEDHAALNQLAREVGWVALTARLQKDWQGARAAGLEELQLRRTLAPEPGAAGVRAVDALASALGSLATTEGELGEKVRARQLRNEAVTVLEVGADRTGDATLRARLVRSLLALIWNDAVRDVDPEHGLAAAERAVDVATALHRELPGRAHLSLLADALDALVGATDEAALVHGDAATRLLEIREQLAESGAHGDVAALAWTLVESSVSATTAGRAEEGLRLAERAGELADRLALDDTARSLRARTLAARARALASLEGRIDAALYDGALRELGAPDAVIVERGAAGVLLEVLLGLITAAEEAGDPAGVTAWSERFVTASALAADRMAARGDPEKADKVRKLLAEADASGRRDEIFGIFGRSVPFRLPQLGPPDAN